MSLGDRLAHLSKMMMQKKTHNVFLKILKWIGRVPLTVILLTIMIVAVARFVNGNRIKIR